MEVAQQKELCTLHDQLALHEVKADQYDRVGICKTCFTLLIKDRDGRWKNALNQRKDIDSVGRAFKSLYLELTDEEKSNLKARMLGNAHAAKLFNKLIGGDKELFASMASSTGAVTDYLRYGHAIPEDQIAVIEEAAMRSPRTAYYYARSSMTLPTHLRTKVDFDKLRVISSKSPTYALKFAAFVDNYVYHPVTKQGVLPDAKQSGKYATFVLKTPDDDLRTSCCQEAYWAYYYAKTIDKSPHDNTRTAACKEHKYAYVYARWVDKRETDETLNAVLSSEAWALEYQKNITRRFHPKLDAVLLNAVDPVVRAQYADWCRFKQISRQNQV